MKITARNTTIKNLASISLMMLILSSCNSYTPYEPPLGRTTFGRYPQTVVKDETLLAALETATDTDNNGYLNYENNEYIKVRGANEKAGYLSDNYYYFLVEPIEWDIMGENELLSSKVLDAQSYFISSTSRNASFDDRTINETKIYSNNYEYSTIRTYLNSLNGRDYGTISYRGRGFLARAFTTDEEAQILTTEVNNNPSARYGSNNTNDKVYVYSLDEMNAKFSSSKDMLRECTDYAICLGLYFNYANEYENIKTANYWLRTSSASYSTMVTYIDYASGTSNENLVTVANGLIPAIRLSSLS